MYGTEQRTYIKVGAIALVAVILLLAGITIGRGLNFATATAEVRIRAATAAGLEPGAPVWINGIKRGSVMSVRPEGDSVLIIVGLDDSSMLRQRCTGADRDARNHRRQTRGYSSWHEPNAMGWTGSASRCSR